MFHLPKSVSVGCHGRTFFECARQVVSRELARCPVVAVSAVVEVGGVDVHRLMDFALAKS